MEGVVLGWQSSLEGGQAAAGQVVMFSSEVLAWWLLPLFPPLSSLKEGQGWLRVSTGEELKEAAFAKTTCILPSGLFPLTAYMSLISMDLGEGDLPGRGLLVVFRGIFVRYAAGIWSVRDRDAGKHPAVGTLDSWQDGTPQQGIIQPQMAKRLKLRNCTLNFKPRKPVSCLARHLTAY